MPLREHEVDAFSEHRPAVQPCVDRARLLLVLVAEHDVQLLEPQRRDRLLDLGLGGFDPDSGMGHREGADGGRDDAQERRLERRDPDDAGELAGRDRGELRLSGLDALQQALRVSHQDLTSRGQPDVPPDPFQQLRADLTLEYRELLGHGARGVAQRGGRRVDRAALVHLSQKSEAMEIQHLFRLSERSRALNRDGRERSPPPTLESWVPSTACSPRSGSA